MNRFTALFAPAMMLAMAPFAASADSWSLSADESKLAFGSIKKDKIGEVHHFKSISGGVSADGAVKIEVDLSSVETWIDIRNERMGTQVFSGMPPATLTANVDLAALEALSVGGTMTDDVSGVLSLGGASVELEVAIFAARLSADKAIITTDEMIFVQMEELGVNDGITKLMEIAKLPSITRTTPVTMRLVFARDAEKAEAPTTTTEVAAAPAPSGDAAAGKKVFKKCKACHEITKPKNKVGPHLVDVIDRPIGSIEGFKYSKPMAALEGNWTVEELTAFLTKPRKYLKGTKMSFAGLKKAKDIENLLAYMRNPE
ncbi:MAG: c-type cytochrome [Pikeienuella sp.]